MKTAMLISTYNWPEALEMVLQSIEKQTVLPDEVLIADDGSNEITKKIIDKYAVKSKTKIKHFWHEDEGFRKAIILNKAVAASQSEYIIQIDGDCFLHPNFVKDHKDFAKKGYYLYGTRVRIKEKYVPKILEKKKTNFNFFSKEIKKRPRILRLPFLVKLFSPQNEISDKFRGANTSFWRDDFIKINGYNEDFQGWGREDSELMIRFHNLGIKAKRLKFAGIVFHLDHFESSKERFSINDSIQEETINKKKIYIENGVNKYL